MSKAIIYLRVSTEEQAITGLGLDAQEAAARAYCEGQGYEVAGVFTDAGVSGGLPVDRREGLTSALAAVKRGYVLVAAKRDRFARDLHIMAILEHTIKALGGRVESPDVPSSDDPFAVALRGMLDVFAELERSMIAARTKAAMGAKKAKGEYTGGLVPYGYELCEGGVNLVECAGEQEALALMVELRGQGLPLRAIAAELKARGIAARRGSWAPSTISNLLKREQNERPTRLQRGARGAA